MIRKFPEHKKVPDRIASALANLIRHNFVKNNVDTNKCVSLLSESKLLDKGTILIDIVLLEILKKSASLTYHLEQTAS